MTIYLCAVFVLVIRFGCCLAAWDPDAGLVKSWTKLPGVTISATSTYASSVNNILDSNDNTHWSSSNCLPDQYFSRQDVNILLGVCSSHGQCVSTQKSADELSKITDGSIYHSCNIPTQTGSNGLPKATLKINFTSPTNITLLSLRGNFRGLTSVSMIDVYGTVNHVINVNQSNSYTDIRVHIDMSNMVQKILIESSSSFLVQELAAMGRKGCTEQVTIDLGSQVEIGYFRTRHWAGTGNALSLSLKLSNDSLLWSSGIELNPDALHAVITRIPTLKAQFIALEYRVVLQNHKKVYCWEIDAWDMNGEWGAPIIDRPQVGTLRELLGVNGIWGWGNKKYSYLLKPSEGAGLYNSVASHARNYHNLNWDVRDPDDDPGFSKMDQCNCTSAMFWLNWDLEYSAWVNKNLKVDASIQFTKNTFSQDKWNHPEISAYNYGREFAKHFGPEVGNGLVYAMEVGNEPWDYDASFYTTILKGMSAGARSVDKSIKVLPGAFQAHDIHDTGNYIGTRVFNDVAANLSAINFHTYSYLGNENGIRVATYPEEIGSSFNSIRNIVRWRDTNTPLKPVWVTEWGWDSHSSVDNCTFSECVTETAQALYAVRGLFLLSRSNVEKATWFFFADLIDKPCNHVYCRSGLTASKTYTFTKKAAFYAFESLLNLLGDKRFLGILKEDKDAYVYAFGKACGLSQHVGNATELLTQSSHIVAWKPVDAADKSSYIVNIPLTPGIIPMHGWKFTGKNPGLDNYNSFRVTQTGLQITVTSHPVVIELFHVNINQVFG